MDRRIITCLLVITVIARASGFRFLQPKEALRSAFSASLDGLSVLPALHLPPSAPASSKLLTFQTAGDSALRFGTINPATGKLTALSTFSNVSGGVFVGVDTKNNHAFAVFGRPGGSGYVFELVTLQVTTGKLVHAAPWPSAVYLFSAYDAAVGLEGLFEQFYSNSSAQSIVYVDPETGVQKTVSTLNSTFSTCTTAAVSVPDHTIFASMYITSVKTGPGIATIDLRSGDIQNIVYPLFPSLHLQYWPEPKLLVDTGFDLDANSVVVITVDPTTGNYSSLNITLFVNVNGYQIGPNALDSASQMYYASLCPQGINCTFFTVDLAARKVIRTTQYSPPLEDMILFA